MHPQPQDLKRRLWLCLLAQTAVLAPLAGSGFVFSGSAPVPPDSVPKSSELVLLSVEVKGPTGMNVRTSYDFFVEGGFLNMGTGLLEDYTMTTVDWDITEGGRAAEGLSVDSDGTFEASPVPGLEYPRSLSIDAVTSEGAPIGEKGEPIEYTDSQALSVVEPSSYTSYDEWVAASSMSGDEDGETQDADDDGLSNGIEFVLGLDPESPNPLSGISQSYDGDTGRFTFSFTVPNDLAAVKLFVETTTDLSADPVVWTEQSLTLQSSDRSTETWGTTVELGTKGFGRLRVETYTP